MTNRRSFLATLCAVPFAFYFKEKSEWREISRAEIMNCRITKANYLRDNRLMSDYDILVKWLHYSPLEAENIVAKLKEQKFFDLKLHKLHKASQNA